MKAFKPGTPVFGLITGAAFAILGALVLWIGFGRTLILAALFAIGYFVGAVDNKNKLVRETVDRVVPGHKEQKPIDFRAEVEKEQETRFSQEPIQEPITNVEENEE